MQLINLHFGGSLYQDLRQEHAGATDHGGAGEVRHHGLELVHASALWRGLPARLSVNSNHQQAISSLASGFSVTARAEDGVIEAIEGLGVYGIEWHPESDAASWRVLENFVDIARR
jgi:putative glutamine amidotransferase